MRLVRSLLQQVDDRRLGIGWVRRRISVDLPRVPGRLSAVRHHPPVDRFVRFAQTAVRPAVDGYGGFAPWCLGRVHLVSGFEGASDLNTEVAQNWGARLYWVVVKENVVAVSP